MMTSSPSACIELKPGTHVAKVVLMPGDPLRAKFVADHYLENCVLFNDVRNMYGYTGTYEGKEVSVMGSGMGMPSFTLYAQELFRFFGVEAIIRIGSAGGIGDDIRVRDLIIAIAVNAAEEIGVHARVGTVYTSDFFYHPDREVNAKAKALGHLAVEMESAGLYLTAMAEGKKALALFQISDHVFTGEALSAAERQDGFNEMMEVALKTAVRIDV